MPVQEPTRDLYIIINGNNYSNFLSCKLDKVKNSAYRFSIQILGEKQSNSDLQEGNIVRLYSGNDEVFKGEINEVSFSSEDLQTTIKGYGMEIKLMRRQADRTTYQFTNAATNTIVDKILSQDGSGSSPYVIEPGVNDITYPTSFRGQFDKKLPIIKGLANAVNLEWWVDQDAQDTDRLNITTQKGSSAPVKTFDTSDNSVNIKRKRNKQDMANVVTATGAGDGVNQVRSFTFHATTKRTTLEENLSVNSDNVDINVADASDFPSSGTMFIGAEKLDFTKTDSTTLHIPTGGRGSSGTENIGAGVSVELEADANNQGYYHNQGTEIYVYHDADAGQTYDLDTPEDGSSVAQNGIQQTEATAKNVIDQDTIDRMAQTYLSEHKDIIEEIIVESTDPMQDIYDVRVGDTCTINNSDIGLTNENYRCVEMHLNYDLIKIPSLKMIFGKAVKTFTDTIEKDRSDTKNLNVYMEGSTSSFNVQSYENCDSTNPLELRFYMPEDVIAINKGKLRYKIKNYRAYTNASQTAASKDLGTKTAQSKDLGTPTSNTNAGTAYDSDYLYGNKSVGTSWTDIDTTLGSDSLVFQVYGTALNDTGSSIDDIVNVRVKTDTGLYFPDSSGNSMWMGANKTISTYSILCGGNLSGATLTLQAKSETGGSLSNIVFSGEGSTIGTHTHDVPIGSHSHSVPIGTHSHSISMDYGIDNPSTNPGSGASLTVKIGPDKSADWGGSTTSTLTSNNSTSPNSIDITQELKDIGTGKWIRVQFETDRTTRVEANAFVKHWVHSTS